MSALPVVPSSVDDAWDELTARVADGDIDSFGQLRALVRTVLTAPQHRGRTGTLLERVDLAGLPGVPVARRVHVTGTATTAPIVASLRAELVAAGILPAVTGGEFGTALENLLGDGADGGDVLVVLLDATLVTDRLPVGWGVADVLDALDEVRELLLGALRAAAEGRLVITTTIAVPPEIVRTVTSLAGRAELMAMWREFDTALLRLAAEGCGVVVLDVDRLLTGPVTLRDVSLAHRAGLELSLGLLDELASEIAHVVRAHAGLTAKALVTDLDDTLWGGVLGDDGVDGVVSEPGRGSGYRDYQRLLASLGAQGVLLAVSSKNDPDLAVRALRERSDVLVDPETFLVVEAAWDPKSEQLKRITTALNISSDAVVVIDDNAFEREEIVSVHPGALAVDASGDAASLVERVLMEDPFLVLRATGEDSVRTASLRASIAADSARWNGEGFDTYLASLDQHLDIAPARESDVPRLAQMTQRTNQFHLVTTRLSEDDVRELLAGPEREVLTMRLVDRHANHGIVGAVFLSAQGNHLVIENMILSCRVFGREVEHAVIDSVLAGAAGKFARVCGLYRASAKNGRFAGFWEACGMRSDGADDPLCFSRPVPATAGTAPDRHLSIHYTPGGLLS